MRLANPFPRRANGEGQSVSQATRTSDVQQQQSWEARSSTARRERGHDTTTKPFLLVPGYLLRTDSTLHAVVKYPLAPPFYLLQARLSFHGSLDEATPSTRHAQYGPVAIRPQVPGTHHQQKCWWAPGLGQETGQEGGLGPDSWPVPQYRGPRVLCLGGPSMP
jgi:hypothetical protein